MGLKSQMQSLYKGSKNKLGLNSSSGVMGLDVAKSFLVVLMSLVIIGVTTLIVLNSLGDTSVVKNDNGTKDVINNATSGVSSFFANTGTWLSLLGVVILILIISAVIFVVNRFGSSGGKNSL
ncbi:MAG: hypothetical protein ABEI74_04750 [Candidatus Pacearchaeota archaeon]